MILAKVISIQLPLRPRHVNVSSPVDSAPSSPIRKSGLVFLPMESWGNQVAYIRPASGDGRPISGVLIHPLYLLVIKADVPKGPLEIQFRETTHKFKYKLHTYEGTASDKRVEGIEIPPDSPFGLIKINKKTEEFPPVGVPLATLTTPTPTTLAHIGPAANRVLESQMVSDIRFPLATGFSKDDFPLTGWRVIWTQNGRPLGTITAVGSDSKGNPLVEIKGPDKTRHFRVVGEKVYRSNKFGADRSANPVDLSILFPLAEHGDWLIIEPQSNRGPCRSGSGYFTPDGQLYALHVPPTSKAFDPDLPVLGNSVAHLVVSKDPARKEKGLDLLPTPIVGLDWKTIEGHQTLALNDRPYIVAQVLKKDATSYRFYLQAEDGSFCLLTINSNEVYPHQLDNDPIFIHSIQISPRPFTKPLPVPLVSLSLEELKAKTLEEKTLPSSVQLILAGIIETKSPLKIKKLPSLKESARFKGIDIVRIEIMYNTKKYILSLQLIGNILNIHEIRVEEPGKMPQIKLSRALSSVLAP